jgi:hypothetical protein
VAHVNTSLVSLGATLVVGGLAFVPYACGDDVRPPPPPSPDLGDAGPASCADVASGSPDGDRIRIDERLASCAAEGLECPLLGPGFGGTCDEDMQPYAVCIGRFWQLTCIDLRNEASTESQADAGDASW